MPSEAICMPNVTIQVNPPDVPVIVGIDDVPPTSITPGSIIVQLDLKGLHFSRSEVLEASRVIAGIVPNAPIVVVQEVLRAVFPGSTFESGRQ